MLSLTSSALCYCKLTTGAGWGVGTQAERNQALPNLMILIHEVQDEHRVTEQSRPAASLEILAVQSCPGKAVPLCHS